MNTGRRSLVAGFPACSCSRADERMTLIIASNQASHSANGEIDKLGQIICTSRQRN